MKSLAEAIGVGNLQACRALLDQGADARHTDDTGWTRLMDAAQSGWPEICALLIERGADLHAVDSYGWSALTYAGDKGHHDVCTLLLAQGGNTDLHRALMQAAENGHARVCALLLEHGADINWVAPCGHTALKVAKDQETKRILRSAKIEASVAGALSDKIDDTPQTPKRSSPSPL